MVVGFRKKKKKIDPAKRAVAVIQREFLIYHFISSFRYTIAPVIKNYPAALGDEPPHPQNFHAQRQFFLPRVGKYPGNCLFKAVWSAGRVQGEGRGD